MRDEEILFAPETERLPETEPTGSWKILIVDDESDVHKVTRLALQGFTYNNKELEFLSTYSATETHKVVQENPDVALILLDVVMESPHAGLDLVKYIRNELGNKTSRIVLRTGQAGQAPEKEVIFAYEINDYKTKTELTDIKLFTILLSSLRSYEALIQLENYSLSLEQKVSERTLELNRQKEELSVKNTAITDSIRYASYIQHAIFTPAEYIKSIFPDYFVLNKPRAIVSGDFYWFYKRDCKVIFCVADCTGHGVPGAFMSMLGISFLNEIVNSNKYIPANEILNELRENVKKSLHQTGREQEQKDGMDIALCILNPDSGELQFAGAYNSIYIYRHVTQNIEEIEPDKMPIGVHTGQEKSFKNNHLSVKPGDKMFLFSDGIADQFGGPNGKKFKYTQFKEILSSNSEKPMAELKELLDKKIEDWKSVYETKYEQTDDITVLGIKV